MNPECPATPFCLLVLPLSSLARKPAYLFPVAISIWKIPSCAFHYSPRHCLSPSLPTQAEGWGRDPRCWPDRSMEKGWGGRGAGNHTSHPLQTKCFRKPGAKSFVNDLILQPLPCEERLRQLGLFSLGRGCSRGTNISRPILTLRLLERRSQVLPKQCAFSKAYDCISDYLHKK